MRELRGIVVIGYITKQLRIPAEVFPLAVDSMPVETSSSVIEYRPLLIPYGVQPLRNEHLNTIETATNDR